MNNSNNDLLSIISIGLAIYGLTRNRETEPVTPYDLAVQNGFTGTLPQYLASLKGRDGVDGINGKNGFSVFADVKALGAVGNGIEDCYPAFQAAANLGGTLFLEQDSVYYLSEPILIRNTIDLNLNGSTIIAPKGFALADGSQTVLHNAGNYFQAETGQQTIPFIEGVTDSFKVGDIIMVQQQAYRYLNSYRHGQIFSVVAINTDGSALLSSPFYADYQVDNIAVRPGIDCTISNGKIDMSQGDGGYYSGIALSGLNRVTIEKLSVYGHPTNAQGIGVNSNIVRISHCHASGFQNVDGIVTGGRTGYGFGLSGTSVVCDSLTADNCKHCYTGANRNYMTINLTLVDCKAYNPGGMAAEMVEIAGSSQPLFGGMFDVHCNVLHYNNIRPVSEGCNMHHAIRSGQAKIIDAIVISTGVNITWANQLLFSVCEENIRTVEIINPTIHTYGGGNTRVCFGIGNSSLMPGESGSYIVRNPVINPDRPEVLNTQLFAWLPLAGLPAQSLETLSITGVRGNLGRGMRVAGGSAGSLLDTIKNLELSGNFRIVGNTTDYGVLNTSFVKNIENITLSGNIDASGFSVESAVYIRVQDDSTAPKNVNLSGLVLKAGGIAVSLSGAPGKVYGGANFNSTHITGNLENIGGTFVPVIYGSLNVAPSEAWTFRNATLINANPDHANNFQVLRFSTASNINLDGLTTNTDVYLPLNAYFDQNAPKGLIPNVINLYDGKTSYKYAGYYIQDGKVYLRNVATFQSGVDTAEALPVAAVPKLYEGFTLYNSGTEAVSPYAWVLRGGIWNPRFL